MTWNHRAKSTLLLFLTGLLTFIGGQTHAFSSENGPNPIIIPAQVDSFIDITANTWVFTDDSNEQTVNIISSLSGTDWNKKMSWNFATDHTYWLRIRLKNPHQSAKNIFLKIGTFDYGGYFINQNFEEELPFGLSIRKNQRTYLEDPAIIQHLIPAGETTDLYIYGVNWIWGNESIFPNKIGLLSPKIIEEAQLKGFKRTSTWIFFFVGIVFVMGFIVFFALAQYLVNKQKAYLYYSLYTLGLLLYNLRRVEISDVPLWTPFEYFRSIIIYLEAPTAYFSYIMYTLFAVSFLGLRAENNLLSKTLKWLLTGMVTVFTLDIILAFVAENPNLNYAIYDIARLLFMLVSIFLTILIIIYKNKLGYFIATGSLFLVLGGATAMILSRTTDFMDADTIWRIPLFYFYMGILLELLLFATGLGYKSNRIMKERNTLQQKLNEQLEQQVEEKTRELEDQKVLQIESDYKRQLAEAENKALRAQINPHFMFNCMNSIKGMISAEMYDEATDYLTDFSHLVRRVLAQSEQKLIPLQQEIETSQLYLNLESLRFDGSFHYSVQIEPGIDLNSYKVPPLILQPYLENAIWHGLLPKKGERILSLSVNRVGEGLRCTIDDNGVGRQAVQTRPTLGIRKKSFGMNLTKNRINYSNYLFQQKITIQIIDKKDDQGKPLGTSVILDFPPTSLAFDKVSES